MGASVSECEKSVGMNANIVCVCVCVCVCMGGVGLWACVDTGVCASVILCG